MTPDQPSNHDQSPRSAPFRPQRPAPDAQDDFPAPDTRNTNVVIFGCVGIAMVAGALGIWKIASPSASPQSAGASVRPSPDAQDIVNHALDVANEAKRLQREHLEHLRQETKQTNGLIDAPSQPQ